MSPRHPQTEAPQRHNRRQTPGHGTRRLTIVGAALVLTPSWERVRVDLAGIVSG